MTPLESLQATLAGEHAAVYVYGVLGGRVSSSEQPGLASQLRAAYSAHRGRRDQLTAMIVGEDAEPVAAQISYRVPGGTGDTQTPAELTAAALELEQRSAAVYADMVASTAGTERRWAIGALLDATVRSLAFGGAPEAFPGIGEL